MNIDYQNMTDQQIKTINEYLKNNMKKLKQVCYFVWGKNNIEQSYHDDLYDDAMEVLVESVIRFNPDGNTKFNTYLTNNIRKSYMDWYRDNFLRAKRNNLELDEKGNIKKDENENPIEACAEKWESSADFTEFTFYIRKNLTWANKEKTPLTSK